MVGDEPIVGNFSLAFVLTVETNLKEIHEC